MSLTTITQTYLLRNSGEIIKRVSKGEAFRVTYYKEPCFEIHPPSIPHPMSFKPYKGSSHEHIIKLFKETFTQSENKEEGEVLARLTKSLLRLRREKDVHIFISEKDSEIVACVMYSPLKNKKRNLKALMLSPMVVTTRLQRKGIGAYLINYSFSKLQEMGYNRIITYGDIQFYKNVGFKKITTDEFPSPHMLSYPEGWLGTMFDSTEFVPCTEKIECIEPFNDQRYW